MSFVVDSSVVAKWFLLDEPDREAARNLEYEEELIAPEFLLVEVTNALWKSRSRGLIEPERAQHGLRYLGRGIPTLHESAPLLPRALDLAQYLHHPVYDCLYLALGLREDALIVTADRRFHQRVSTSEYTGATWLLGDQG